MMVLSKKDKEEIAAMFEAFAFRMGPQGQQSRPVDRMVYDYTTGTVLPAVETGALAFTERMTTGRQYVPFPEQVVGAAIETALVPSKRKKAMTKFNKAFSAVTKAVSKARKGRKITGKSIMAKVGRKAVSILGKVSKTQRGKRKRPGIVDIASRPVRRYG